MFSSLHTTHLTSPRRLYNLMHLSAFLLGAYAFGFPQEIVSPAIVAALMALTGLMTALAATAYTPLRTTPHNYRTPLIFTGILVALYVITEQLRAGPENTPFLHAAIGGALAVFIASTLFVATLTLLRDRRRF